MKYLSLFSGIGGFEVGMQNSKHEFECIGFSEVDKYAISIYTRQFPEHRGLGDVKKINTGELEDFELLVGGFPCQAFSIAGKRRGFNDCRGTLFFEIARILKDKRPKYFLLENVKGLLSHDRGRTFKTILRVLNELRYDVSWSIYNSKDYGVPQSRERLFIKGYLRGECGKQVLSFRGKSSEIIETMKLKQINNNVQRSFGDRVYSSDGLARTICGDGGGLDDKTGLYAIQQNFKKISDDKYMTTTKNGDAFAVTTVNRGKPLKNKEDVYVLETEENYKIRRLTPVECERLQGFPDDWTKWGRNGELISDSQRYKCLGNAVTTNVITHILDNWGFE